jgi:hypothetical protein
MTRMDRDGGHKMSWKELPHEILASIGAVGGKKPIKDAKKELQPGEHNVDFVVRVKGHVKKGPISTRQSDNPAVNFAALFAAAVEGRSDEEIGEILELAKSEQFLADFTAQGGKSALHKEVASAMGVPAKIEKQIQGSVSCTGLELQEWAHEVELGRAVELLEWSKEQEEAGTPVAVA